VVGGKNVFHVPCSPDEEMVWVALKQVAPHLRQSWFRLSNVASPDWDANP
jgi:hypothetical protein